MSSRFQQGVSDTWCHCFYMLTMWHSRWQFPVNSSSKDPHYSSSCRVLLHLVLLENLSFSLLLWIWIKPSRHLFFMGSNVPSRKPFWMHLFATVLGGFLTTMRTAGACWTSSSAQQVVCLCPYLAFSPNVQWSFVVSFRFFDWHMQLYFWFCPLF